MSAASASTPAPATAAEWAAIITRLTALEDAVSRVAGALEVYSARVEMLSTRGAPTPTPTPAAPVPAPDADEAFRDRRLAHGMPSASSPAAAWLGLLAAECGVTPQSVWDRLSRRGGPAFAPLRVLAQARVVKHPASVPGLARWLATPPAGEALSRYALVAYRDRNMLDLLNLKTRAEIDAAVAASQEV